MSAYQGGWGFPVGFYCEHSGSGSRVLARLVAPQAPDVLVPVVSAPDAVLAQRLADLLVGIAEHGVDAGLHADAEVSGRELPAAEQAGWQAAVEHATAGRWPLPAATATALEQVVASDVAVAAAEAAEELSDEGYDETEEFASGEEGDELEEAADEVIVVEVDRTLRLQVLDPQRVFDAAHADDWEPAAPEERGEADPDDLVGAVMWLAENVRFLPGVEVLHEDTQAQLVDAAVVSISDDHPDFAALFEIEEAQAAGDEADGGWKLTPRTAAALYTALSALGDHAYEDVVQHGDATVDPGDEAWLVFSRLPRGTFGQDGAWRRQFARAADDLAEDLEAGRWPQPRDVAEQVCLYLAITDAESVEELLQDTALPWHDDDYDWETCLEVLFDDTDFLKFYEADGDGSVRPADWFTPFGNREARDPERGFRE